MINAISILAQNESSISSSWVDGLVIGVISAFFTTFFAAGFAWYERGRPEAKRRRIISALKLRYELRTTLGAVEDDSYKQRLEDIISNEISVLINNLLNIDCLPKEEQGDSMVQGQSSEKHPVQLNLMQRLLRALIKVSVTIYLLLMILLLIGLIADQPSAEGIIFDLAMLTASLIIFSLIWLIPLWISRRVDRMVVRRRERLSII